MQCTMMLVRSVLMLLVCAETSKGECIDTFSIVRSSNSFCPRKLFGEPCLTIQEYAVNPSLHSNVSLILESGNHTLLSALRTVDASSLVITADGHATLICGTTQAQIVVASLQFLSVSDITFTGCRISVFQLDSAVGRAVFSNAVFHDDYGYFGGAISIRLGSVESLLVIDCIFHMNGANGGGGSIGARRSNVTIVRSIFNRTSTSREGGAVSSQESFITVVNSSFTHTRGGRGGGAISVSRDSSLEVTNCNFSNAETSESGGAIYAVDTHLLHINKSNFSSCSSRYHGGALQIGGNKNRLTLIQNNFNDNRAHEYYGGAITINSPFEVIIEQNNFINNKAIATTNGQGGALFVGNAQGLSLNQCSFINNNAWAIGGAIRAYVTTKPVYVNNSYFCNNTAGHTGGAVNLDGTSILSTNQSSFLNNVAGSDGGAISAYNWNSLTRIYGSTFYNNSAGRSGGAIHMSAGNFPLFVNQSNFTYNTAGTKGGGVSVSGTTSSLSVTDCNFAHNMATGEGGGALHSNGRNANVSLERSVWIQNTAAFCGVIHVEDIDHKHVKLLSSVFSNNHAVDAQISGGGVACVQQATILTLNSTFNHNSALNHGGVLIVDGSTVTIESCRFLWNSAGSNGGVLYTSTHSTTYHIDGSIFTGNTAGMEGGVIYLGTSNSDARIVWSTVSYNSAGNRGGGISILGSMLYINQTVMYNNIAPEGGVVSACSSQVTVISDGTWDMTDPSNPSCTLYEGYIFNNTETTAPPTTLPKTTEPLTTANPTTITTTVTSLVTTNPTTRMKTTASTTMQSTPATITRVTTTNFETTPQQTEISQPHGTTGQATTTEHRSTAVTKSQDESQTSTIEDRSMAVTKSQDESQTSTIEAVTSVSSSKGNGDVTEMGTQSLLHELTGQDLWHSVVTYLSLSVSSVVIVLLILVAFCSGCILFQQEKCQSQKSKHAYEKESPGMAATLNFREELCDNQESPVDVIANSSNDEVIEMEDNKPDQDVDNK